MNRQSPKVAKRMAALKELARVASVMVDGEDAEHVVTDRAMHYIANPDPKHRFLAGDYFDVDFDGFLRAKKTLLRLSRLVDFRCDTVLWMKVKGRDELVTPLLHNGTLSQWYRFGASSAEAAGPMAECLRSGEVTPVEDGASDMLTVLAPVRDSLGDVVGLVELSAPDPVSEKLAPVWN
jgi:hypothetical protein